VNLKPESRLRTVLNIYRRAKCGSHNNSIRHRVADAFAVDCTACGQRLIKADVLVSGLAQSPRNAIAMVQ